VEDEASLDPEHATVPVAAVVMLNGRPANCTSCPQGIRGLQCNNIDSLHPYAVTSAATPISAATLALRLRVVSSGRTGRQSTRLLAAGMLK
jgi:hypothetical protein